MLNQRVHQSETARALFLLHKPFFSGHGNTNVQFLQKVNTQFKKSSGSVRVQSISNNIRASSATDTERTVTIKATVSVKLTVSGALSNLGLERGLDDWTDLVGKSLLLELVSKELNPNLEEKKIKAYAHRVSQVKGVVKYEANFSVPPSFGGVGAVLVENEHHKEMFLTDISLNGFVTGPVEVTCNSWVASKYDNPELRVFFINKSYIPGETPSGLKGLRKKELEHLRGNGEGERKTFERIYDWDIYNDLGDPDTSDDMARPVLGGQERPYPRRCRTGRGPTKKDPLSEKRSSLVYVPRDEAFSEAKFLTFGAKTLKSVLHAVIPQIDATLLDPDLGFPYFTAIDKLYNEGVALTKLENIGIFKQAIPRLIKTIADGQDSLLLFETPEMLDRDKFSWIKDEEFSRQTLAGLNPYSIQAVTEWPLKSKLDPAIYGPPESLITTELIEREIKGLITIKEALKQKKLFMLDYHDLLLPYVSKVRGIKGTTLYASRTLFFLTPDSTLRPLAIELTRPPMNGKPQWKQVFLPGWNSTQQWLWKFAKAHVCAHDSGYHQLHIHWCRTHCVMETYVIAANRQLSALHPIYRLLHPHFRYTLEINALARLSLINAGGTIESVFAPSKFSMELSSAAYAQLWRFDMEGLPADLIRRGLAVEDSTAKHGLKLAIEDYPFANDGLILWDAIKDWVSDYVNHYYKEDNLVEADAELQGWWTEVRTKGHEDKKDEPWYKWRVKEGGMVVLCGMMPPQAWSMTLSVVEEGDRSDGKIWCKLISDISACDHVLVLGWEQGLIRDDLCLLEITVLSCGCEGTRLHQLSGEGITVGADDEDVKLRWASRDLAEHVSGCVMFCCLFSAEASLRSSVT
ncbi:hypothetical protein GIB67_040227 [Kingdonia uniflora]|uniref:Lipoxygenase n=1 Tax=Kingdonia uniflora TaxID=39325 RepID=A0A7J7MUZ3_9MAGN|nr:hypothetical protein GIB67_040227 [Kingdonia uniflora]